jgi:hypothetical protein
MASRLFCSFGETMAESIAKMVVSSANVVVVMSGEHGRSEV